MDAIKVTDLESGVGVDVRELPDIIALARREEQSDPAVPSK